MLEWLLEFPEFIQVPLADWIDAIMSWVLHNWAVFFDVIGGGILSGIFGILSELLGIDSFSPLLFLSIPSAPWSIWILTALSAAVIAAGIAAGVITWRTTGRLFAVILAVVLIISSLAFISLSILFGLLGIEKFLLWLPWIVTVLLVGVVAWRVMRLWWAGLLLAAFMVLIGSFGYWDFAMMTLAIIITAVIISLAVGIPTGIIMAGSNRVESTSRPILDAMQTIPSFVYLIPAMMLFGLGKVPAVFATVIYAAPPVIRLTNVGIRQVSPSVIEAARAFGSSSRQILFEVQLPLAIPSIMLGINQTTMMALAMVVIASMVGARGVGLEVLLAINRIEIGRGFEAGFTIVLLAIIIDRITSAMAARQQYKVST